MWRIFTGLKPTRKNSAWVVGMIVLIFAIVSLGVLLNDVTRDDVTAMHDGFDGTKFASAEVGSFFEVSADQVHGPLCADAFSKNDGRLQILSKTITVVNKLGESFPVLTALSDIVLGPVPIRL